MKFPYVNAPPHKIPGRHLLQSYQRDKNQFCVCLLIFLRFPGVTQNGAPLVTLGKAFIQFHACGILCRSSLPVWLWEARRTLRSAAPRTQTKINRHQRGPFQSLR